MFSTKFQLATEASSAEGAPAETKKPGWSRVSVPHDSSAAIFVLS